MLGLRRGRRMLSPSPSGRSELENRDIAVVWGVDVWARKVEAEVDALTRGRDATEDEEKRREEATSTRLCLSLGKKVGGGDRALDDH